MKCRQPSDPRKKSNRFSFFLSTIYGPAIDVAKHEKKWHQSISICKAARGALQRQKHLFSTLDPSALVPAVQKSFPRLCWHTLLTKKSS